MSMKLQMEAAIAEVISERGDAELKSALGRFLADHGGVIADAALRALLTPSAQMLEAMEPWSRVSGHHEQVWKAGVRAALIWPAGSADRAGVPLARD